MELSIIIVSYNTLDLTIACLDSIANCVNADAKLAQQLEIIVVDNASSDDSVAAVKNWKKTSHVPLTLLANTTNVGFARANNQAMLQAKGTYLLLLNSDTIVQSDALQQMLTAANDVNNESMGIFAASLINLDGSPQSQGGDLPTLTSLFVFAFLLDDLPLVGKLLPSHQHTGRRFDPPSDLTLENKGWVAGTAMLIRSTLVPQIGLLDEDIFMYGEDLEYCWRARDAGKDCAIIPTAMVIHLGSKSSSNARALEGELISLKYVLAKHLPKWQVPIAHWLLKAAAWNRQVLFKILGNTEKSSVYRSILHRL